MRKPTALLATTALLLGLVLTPAGASDDIRPTFRTEQAYFTCPGPTKVHQVNWLAGIGNPSTFGSWDTDPPAGSVTDGEGCGSLDVGNVTNSVYGPIFLGYFDGNLRDMTVRLDHILFGHTRGDGPQEIAVHLEIEGVPVLPPGPTAGGRVMVQPVLSDNGLTEAYEFSITNLGFAEDILDEDGNVIGVDRGGLAREDGDGSFDYELLLMIGGTTYPMPGAWVWDTTEVPGGIEFNPSELADATLTAALPNF